MWHMNIYLFLISMLVIGFVGVEHVAFFIMVFYILHMILLY